MKKRGFSLLEVVLAIGLFGSVLVALLDVLVHAARKTKNDTERILLRNARKNLENYSIITRKELMSECEMRYHGRQGGHLQLSTQTEGLEGEIFVLQRVKTEQQGNIVLITYELTSNPNILRDTVLQAVAIAPEN